VGNRAAALTAELVAKGVLPSLHKIPKNKSAQDVVVQHITFAAGDASAYHYHPGPVFVVVAAGTLTEDDGCGGTETHTTGSAFQEVPGHIHRVTNGGTDAVEAWLTYIVPDGQPLSTRATPVCKPHDDSDDD
jgi:quercetin dioxygenase-like cupin family protein